MSDCCGKSGGGGFDSGGFPHDVKDILKMTDCPHCGKRFSKPDELLLHVFIYHSS
jgi:hypothetical protein